MLVDTVPFSLITTTDVDVPRAPLAAASVNPSAPAPFRKFRRLRPARYPRDGLFIAPTRLFIDSFYIFRYQSLSRLPCVKNLNACDVYPLGSFARSPEHEEIGRASCKMIAMISERRAGERCRMTRRIDAYLDPLGMLMGADLVEAQPSRLDAEDPSHEGAR